MLTPLTGYSVSLEMAARAIPCHADWMEAYDYGATRDNYTAQVRYIAEEGAVFPTRESNTPADIGGNGFLPFCSHVTYPVQGYMYPEYRGKRSGDGGAQEYSVEIIPSAPVTVHAVPWVAKGVTGFKFGTMSDFPVPEMVPESEYNILFNRVGNVVREYDRRISTLPRIAKMRWTAIDNEACGSLLYYITTQVRTTSFTVEWDDFLRMSPWELREGETGTGPQLMRLNNYTVSILHRSGNHWDVEIEVRKWRVLNGA